MGGRLDGKRAIVTAAGQGIGRAIAERFITEGAEVWASDVAPDKLSKLAAHDCRALDVRDSEAVSAYADEIGKIDILANIAGYVHHGTVLDCDEESWTFSFDLNVTSMHRTIRAFLPQMIERAKETQRTTSIINMSSGASSLKGAPNRYVYGATKAAVIGLTKAVAIDFASDQVRCNAICPGTVTSPSLEERMQAQVDETRTYEEVYATFLARQPMGRIAGADEIAALAAFLGSDDAAFITGSEYKIDGGWTL